MFNQALRIFLKMLGQNQHKYSFLFLVCKYLESEPVMLQGEREKSECFDLRFKAIKLFHLHAKYKVYINVNWFKYTKRNDSLGKLNMLQTTGYKGKKTNSLPS